MTWVRRATALTCALLLVGAAALVVWQRSGAKDGSQVATAPCDRVVRVVAAASFAPVLARLEPSLAQGAGCLRIQTVESDGRAAAGVLSTAEADVWIPDDAAWAGSAPAKVLAPPTAPGFGAVVATSPIYMVTDADSAARITRAGGSWNALADLLQSGSGLRMVVQDPEASGDGMLGAGSVAEAVWVTKGMDASAVALAKILPVTRTVPAGTVPMPGAKGEVGLVPEYALLASPPRSSGAPAVLAGKDHTAMLRYTWFPTASAMADPQRAKAVEVLRSALTGPAGTAALDAAHLRRSDGTRYEPPAPPGKGGSARGAAGGAGAKPVTPPPPAQAASRVPSLTAAPLPVLGGHHVDHVFASWYREDRRMNVTMVVDVSWSMASVAPGSKEALIGLVRQGGRTVANMLPDESRLGIWKFGSRLDGNRDHRVVLPIAPLDAGHRNALARAIKGLVPEHTGTGLYDTILAAYVAARDAFEPGSSNQVMVFTDGLNEDDPGSISLRELSTRITAAQDPDRPVQLSLVAFGKRPEVEKITKALEPVRAYVEPLETAAEVEAMFIHLATGGLHTETP